jgi:small conductance mechanosensitive channel
LVEKTVQDLPFVLTAPAAQAWITALEAGGIAMQATDWIDQRTASLSLSLSLPLAQGEAIRKVKRALEATGISIPDNTRAIAMIEAAPHRYHPAREPDIATAVDSSHESALETMIATERRSDDSPDLLGQGGQPE